MYLFEVLAPPGQGHLVLTHNGLLYHTTSESGAYDILAHRQIVPGKRDGSSFVSFSEKPLLGHPDIAASDVCIGFHVTALVGQIEPVQYSEEWYDTNPEKAAYVAGEGWYQQWEAPEDAYDKDGFEDEEIYNAAHREAELDSFLDKADEHEWVTRDEREIVHFRPQDVAVLLAKEPGDWQQVLVELGYKHVLVRGME